EGTLGSGTLPFDIHAGAFDNAYFSWDGVGSNPGHLYMCGTAALTKAPTLYQIPFDGVSSVTVTAGGSGYTSAPGVSFTGTGSGATATSTIAGPVSSLALASPNFGGSGYHTAPGVTIAAPSPGPGTTATANSTITGTV